MSWTHCRVLVTGGASFIGSALVDTLAKRVTECPTKREKAKVPAN